MIKNPAASGRGMSKKLDNSNAASGGEYNPKELNKKRHIGIIGSFCFSHEVCIMKFGNFYIGQNINEIRNNLEDVSEQMFNSVFTKVFADEKIYKGKKIVFLDTEWGVILGVTNNKVYKIALQFTASQQEITPFNKVKAYFENTYGEPNDVDELEGSCLYTWYTKEGNTILETGKKTWNNSSVAILNIVVTEKQPIQGKPIHRKVSYSFIFFIVSLILIALLFFVGRFFGNVSIFISSLVIAIFMGPYIGRSLAKSFYLASTTGIIIIGFMWGAVVAFLLRLLFNMTSPGIILSIIGYGAGTYISIPNYEVFARKNPFPELSSRVEENQEIINFAGIVGFVVSSIIFYFVIS